MKLFLVALAALLPFSAQSSTRFTEFDDLIGIDTLFQRDNVIDAGLTGTKTLALTFDDGPTATTDRVLDILRAHGVPGVFFVNGKNMPGRPGTLRRIFQEGHLLANHTEAHVSLHNSRYSNSSTLVRDIKATHEKMRPYIRSNDVLLFRAPFGAWRSQHAAVLNADPELKRYVGPIFWNIGGALTRTTAADWACWSRGVSVERCMQGYINESLAKKGGIVLFHDVNPKTAQMLDGYIRAMKNQGYSFVRLDEMPKIKRLQ